MFILLLGVPVFYSASCNWQPLHEAAKSGDLRVAELLIQYGARVNEAQSKLTKSRYISCVNIYSLREYIILY